MEFFLTEVYRWRIPVGILILLSIFLLVSMVGRQPPGKFRLFLSQAGIVIALVALLAMVFSGSLHWVFAVIGALLPIVVRLLPLLWRAAVAKPKAPPPARARSRKSSRKRASKAKSSDDSGGNNGYTNVQTRYLRMSISEQTGEMRGKIVSGVHSGGHLSELTLKKLQALHAQYTRRDAESAALLAAYIEQAHGTSARQESGEAHADNKSESKSDRTEKQDRADSRQSKANGGGMGKGMSHEEAYEILGLKAGADAKTVTDAHRRLMQKMHPDRGGTNYLAAKINQAKDLLAG
ncbi:MAG: DnaJ domain-containing protein [Gammaproteobacteria bacterium]|nr:DnaJ domain-containing protein [Gammaproteobacteria bacterium]